MNDAHDDAPDTGEAPRDASAADQTPQTTPPANAWGDSVRMVKRIVEAALLASNQAMSVKQLAGLFPEGEEPSDQILQQALESLGNDCDERGVELVEVASGFRYQVRREIYPWVSRLWTERQTRYGRAVLETFALIAYRQPITRGEIEQIRGVAVNSNIIRTLEERDWIRVMGHRDVPGKPALLGTTRGFLDYFGLRSLDQLPPLAELRDIPDLEPELPFGSDQAPVARITHVDVDVDVDTDTDTDTDTPSDTDAPKDPDTHTPGTVETTEAPTPDNTAGSVDHDDTPPERNNP